MSKKFILNFLIVVICINMFSVISYGLEINDKNLLAELLNAADKNHNGQVDDSEVKDLKYLQLDNKYISDISDLKQFYNLETLISHNHSITDLTPLASLSKLTYLDLGLDTLSTNSISDISPLKNMYNLDYLDLANHSISDISVLSGLTGLKNLILENNLIVEVSPLANLNELTLLNIQGNELEPDLDFLTDLDDLQRLYVDDTYINTQDELAFFASGIHLYLQASTPRVFNEFSPSSNTNNNPEIAVLDNNELVIMPNAPEPKLSYSSLDTIRNRSQAVNLVGDAVSDLTAVQKKDQQVINLVTDFAEEAIYQVANKSFNSSNIITNDFIADLGKEAEQTANELEAVIKKNGIDLNRPLDHNVMLSTNEKAGTFTVDKSIGEAKDIDNLRIATKDVNLEIDINNFKEENFTQPLKATVNVNGSGMFAGMANYGSTSYSVSYSPYAPSKSITIGLPKTIGDLDFQAAFRNDELVGGKYNPASDKVEIQSSLPGEYIVKEHYQDFSDIESKDQQMQDAIKLLVSKDIIDGKTSTQFMPDDAIKRSELAVMLIKTIYMHNVNAKVNFIDVSPADWFYTGVASAVDENIMSGFPDRTFRPDDVVTKVDTISALVKALQSEKDYYLPSNNSMYLMRYKDASKIPQWAESDVALATREGLVIPRADGNFSPDTIMTRGEVALLLQLLFDKL